MAGSVTTPTFSTVINRVLDKSVTSTLEQAYARGERLKRGISRLNDLFYRHLAQKIVGVNSPPDLGALTPTSWEPLSKRAEKNGFYLDKGHLASWLNQASASELLGPPVVTLSTRAGKVGDIEGFQKTIVRRSTRGKKWVQTLTFANFKTTGVRGFIKRDELIQYLQPFLRVRAFSSLPDNLAGSSSIAEWLTGGQSDAGGKPVKHKFLNVRGRELRPIVRPYLDWWLNVRINRLVERFGDVLK